MTATVLAGDVGGTNARFAVFGCRDGLVELIEEITFPSRAFAALPEALAALLAQCTAARSIDRACFGIAGPVRENRCDATNLPWVVDGADVAEVLGLEAVSLLNDLEAAAWGLDALAPDGLATLRHGAGERAGHRALLAPGTGLGQAVLVWDGRRHLPCASEGGHADFAPRSELQVELWRHLEARYGHVSWERVLSGPGLVALFRFLHGRDGAGSVDWLDGAERTRDPAAEISRRAREGRCRVSRQAVDLFVELLAAEAGNLALRSLSTGGLYLAGGMAPKLRGELTRPEFLQTLSAKGRFREWLDTVPVHLVVDERVGLFGAAARAFAGEGPSSAAIR